MMKGKGKFRRGAALLSAAVLGATCAGFGGQGLLSALAQEEAVTYQDYVVNHSVTEDKKGFTVLSSGAAEGEGVTITQEAVPFTYAYLAVSLLVSYSLDAAGDEYLPVKVVLNGNALIGADSGKLSVRDKTGETASVEYKFGYLFLTPEFEGTVYFPQSMLGGATEVTSFSVTVDGFHDAEFVIQKIYGCGNIGDELGDPIVNDNNMKVTVDDNVTVGNGFAVTNSGAASGEGVHITQDSVPFSSKYLGFDLKITGTGSDPYIYARIAVNGGTPVDVASSYTGTNYPTSRRDNGTESVVNKFGGWFIFPNGFDGMFYIDAATYLSDVTEIHAIDILFDGGHTGSFKLNNIFGCEKIGSAFNPVVGTLFSADTGATIDKSTVENTEFSVSAGFRTSPAVSRDGNGYLALYTKMLTYGQADKYAFFNLTVNGQLITERGTVFNGYPSDGSAAVDVEHKWGNWFVVPPDFDGVIYIPLDEYLPGFTALSSFTFTFDGGHKQKFEYKVGYASGLGETPTYIDFDAAEETETVAKVARFENFVPDFGAAVSVMDLDSFTASGGAINDSRVVCGEHICVFDSYSYSDVNFGGICMEEKSWKDSLVIHVKSPFEGGKPTNGVDHGDEYGFLEFTLGEPIDLQDGIALNVQCLSGECYFRVFLVDENGGVWAPVNDKTYPLAAEGVPVGMATLFNNFFYSEGTYGTLYIAKETLVADTFYLGETVDLATEMGKIVKIAFSMDMRNGLGREMCVGTIANVRLELAENTVAVDRLFITSELTDEELGIGTAHGTVVNCPQLQIHIDNFDLCREAEEDAPDYVEPVNPPNPDNPNPDKPNPDNPNEPNTPDSPKEEGNGGAGGCGGAITLGSAGALGGMVAAAVLLLKKRKK